MRKNFRFLMFGMLVATLSGFGQTYFIGVYRPVIRDEFLLSDSEFGLYYLILTMASSLGINRFGHLIDRIPLERYVTFLILALSGACFLLGLSGPVLTVFAGILATRLLGQGMMTHTAMTSMSRYFVRERGRAVAFAGLGSPLAQSSLPAIAVMLMAVMPWRETWLFYGAFLVCVGLPAVLWLLRGHKERHALWQQALEAAEKAATALKPERSARRRDVLRDPNFYLLLPGVLTTPLWVTAVFFFAENYATFKGLSLRDLTALYWPYALGAASVPLVGGVLVDRFGGLRLLPVYPPIIATGIAIGVYAETGLGIGMFMACLGLAVGLAGPINNALWAELYGTRHLGEIKSLTASIAILSTAISPFVLGLLLDRGVPISTLLLAGTVHGFTAVLLQFVVIARRR